MANSEKLDAFKIVDGISWLDYEAMAFSGDADNEICRLLSALDDFVRQGTYRHAPTKRGAAVMLERILEDLEHGKHGGGPKGDGGLTLELRLLNEDDPLLIEVDICKALKADCELWLVGDDDDGAPMRSRALVAARLRYLADEIELNRS